jgi:multidrug efflux pump subunit AcrA (membrane-fusion protein)
VIRSRRRTVYRKAALDKLASPEELDRLMQITSPGAWLALVALGGVLLMVLLWGIFGQITTTLDRSGLLTLSNPIVFVPAPDNGQVSDITVQAGDVITAGQVVAHLTTAAEPLDVTSAVNGRVNSVRVDRGAPVDTGTPLISIESFDRDKPQQEVVIYVPFEDRQRIREGMDAQVLPSTVELEKYGYMQGDVRSVARFAATRQEMLAVLNDPSFVERLAATGQLFEVRIALRTDDDGQVIWSTSDGPAASIVSGTPCLVTIQIDQERPISKIFNLSD